jgi:hypothetical protein
MEARIIEGWEQGIDEFNHGRFWHAHHGWELEWRSLPAPLREHVKAMIQGCAVFHHLENGRLPPARSIAMRALELLAEVDACGGIAGISPRFEIPGIAELLADFPCEMAQIPGYLKRARTLRAFLVVKS